MSYFEIDNKEYAIDMSELMAWVSKTPANEKNITTSITQLWPIMEDGDDSMQKEVTETKSTLNENLNNVRYDFVRILINTVLNPLYSPDGIVTRVNTLSELTFGQKLAFNSLLKEGIIVEIN